MASLFDRVFYYIQAVDGAGNSTILRPTPTIGAAAPPPFFSIRLAFCAPGVPAPAAQAELVRAVIGRSSAAPAAPAAVAPVQSTVLVFDAATGQTTPASLNTRGAATRGDQPAVSDNGQFVAYSSTVASIVGGDTNQVADVFVLDRATGTTTVESVTSAGVLGDGDSTAPSISADGRYVAFKSVASNLASGVAPGIRRIYLRDRGGPSTVLLTPATESEAVAPSISGDGRFVAFATSSAAYGQGGDANGTSDIYVADRDSGIVALASAGPGGTAGAGLSVEPAIARDGRHVVFTSAAPDLVAGDTNGDVPGTATRIPSTDVFARDLVRGATIRISVNSAGAQVSGRSSQPSVSATGQVTVFASLAASLVTSDANGQIDAFARDLPPIPGSARTRSSSGPSPSTPPAARRPHSSPTTAGRRSPRRAWHSPGARRATS